MAPTIQNRPTNLQEKKDPQINNKNSELLLKVKYCNSLPDFPFDLKFIKYPFPSMHFVTYTSTTLESNFKYDLLNEPDLGIEIDLVDQEPYSTNLNTQLEPSDEKILEEETFLPQDSSRSKHHAKSVSWLRRTQYISTEQTRFQPQTMEKVEARVGYNIKKTLAEGILYMDRKKQIEAIKKTFEDCKKPIERHHSKPSVVPVEILPIFPDFALWKYPCAQVIFESDPAPAARPVFQQIEEMSQAMIRGVKDESGEQFVAYFLPTQETLEKRKRDIKAGVNYMSGEEYNYKISREYNWSVRSKASKGYEENYFFVVRENGIFYNELETRVRLCKRRKNYNQILNNTRLIVKHRLFTNNELKVHRIREKQLEPIGYDDSDQEEEEQIQPQVEENENKDGSENNVISEGIPLASSVESHRQSRSRSRSKSRSKSKSRSRSRSKSTSRSRSRSLSSRSRSESESSHSTNKSTSSNARSIKSEARSRSSSRSNSKSPSSLISSQRSSSDSENESATGSKKNGPD